MFKLRWGFGADQNFKTIGFIVRHELTHIWLGKSVGFKLTKITKSGIHKTIGDVIEYELVLTNSGNVTIMNIELRDDNADFGSISLSRIDKLEAGESVNITARHTITQKDLDRRFVYNQAFAKGEDPTGKDVEAGSKDNKPQDPGTPIDPDCPNCTITPIEIEDFFIPNVFTPNGDGTHDLFVIRGLEHYDNTELTIFNRWGNEVYRNKNYKNNWDGNSLNEATYYYLIVLKRDGTETVHKGWVLLKR